MRRLRHSGAHRSARRRSRPKRSLCERSPSYRDESTRVRSITTAKTRSAKRTPWICGTRGVCLYIGSCEWRTRTEGGIGPWRSSRSYVSSTPRRWPSRWRSLGGTRGSKPRGGLLCVGPGRGYHGAPALFCYCYFCFKGVSFRLLTRAGLPPPIRQAQPGSLIHPPLRGNPTGSDLPCTSSQEVGFRVGFIECDSTRRASYLSLYLSVPFLLLP